ncbi:MAG: glutamate-1-semialdehyde 2,1-aminomutase [Acidobacteria bacterium]|nr:glutamate-1-semialdehyde 2,1-aminomutase [Acidobacteriota bacterium]
MNLSRDLFDRARAAIAGGVNSPVRAFRAVGGDPIFFDSAKGSRLRDVDGREYIDYVCSWGPLILGHADPRVVEAVREQVGHGSSFGAPTRVEVELAESLTAALPAMERVRMVNSGTEATLSAVRLARGFTRRNGIVKMEGCYHGHVDALLVQAGSGVATLSIPGSPGIPEAVTAQTFLLPYNDAQAARDFLRERGTEIAAVIVEPVAGNMGVVPPRNGYLEALRAETRRAGALLIFDEVITGFRLAYGGVQTMTGIEPDLTCMGKVIGGGFPVGAYGGRAEVMAMVAPDGPVYQAGTLSGNPVAMRAGLTTLQVLRDTENAYDRLDQLGARLENGLKEAAREAGARAQVARRGSMLTVFFTDAAVSDWTGAAACDTEMYGKYFRSMIKQGIYLPPAQYETFFVSLAHSESDIDETVNAARTAFRACAR